MQCLELKVAIVVGIQSRKPIASLQWENTHWWSWIFWYCVKCCNVCWILKKARAYAKGIWAAIWESGLTQPISLSVPYRSSRSRGWSYIGSQFTGPYMSNFACHIIHGQQDSCQWINLPFLPILLGRYDSVRLGLTFCVVFRQSQRSSLERVECFAELMVHVA